MILQGVTMYSYGCRVPQAVGFVHADFLRHTLRCPSRPALQRRPYEKMDLYPRLTAISLLCLPRIRPTPLFPSFISSSIKTLSLAISHPSCSEESPQHRPPRRDLGRSGRKSGFRGRFCVDKAYLERDPIKFFRWISNSPPRCGKPAVFPLFKSFCRSTRAFSTDSDTTGTRSTIKCSAAKQHSNLDVVGRVPIARHLSRCWIIPSYMIGTRAVAGGSGGWVGVGRCVRVRSSAVGLG
ncbi:hypothetical protein R3P38DRAFT_3286884, partial [Favolaschia claudopus]